MRKPRVFIGSAKESIEIAYAVQENLDRDAEITVWDQGIIDLSSYTLEELLTNLQEYDFGIFVFSPDDVIKIRGKKHKTVRDNVLFELGLFVGRLGRERIFILVPQETNQIHIPSDLFGLTLAEFNPSRQDKNLKAALGPACNKIRKKLSKTTLNHDEFFPQGVKLVDREQFTRILFERLSNTDIKTIRIVTYTSEVDAGLINRFHIQGSKTFEIYKRSILSDLAEEQNCNIQAIASGSTNKIWDKKRTSIDVSEKLSSEVCPGSTITQYFYYAPPSKRAYLFNQDEAIIAYYEILDSPIDGPCSIYRGMSKSYALHVTRESRLAGHLLDELENYIAGLKLASRSWEDERRILKERGTWIGYGKRPCVEPRAVFLDLDGVLFDSLPMYVKAWQEAFQSIGIEFPEERVYLEEGRRGSETAQMYLQEINFPHISEETIKSILSKKREVLSRIGRPKPQKGAIDLIRAISKSEIEILVVTGSSNKKHVSNISDTFRGLLSEDQVISGQDVRSGKPDPDPYLLACHIKKVHPHEAIVVENAPLGIKAADAAGTFCIAVNTGILSNSVLKNAGARAVFKSCSTLANCWDKIISVLKD